MEDVPYYKPSEVVFGEDDYNKLARLVYDRWGISLSSEKFTRTRIKMQSLMREQGYQDFKSFLHALASSHSAHAFDVLAEKLTINYTFFNREQRHFEYMRRSILPEMERKRFNEIRIWCAGCASGEEAYSIAIHFEEYRRSHLPTQDFDYLMLATDLSRVALERGLLARYTLEALQKGWSPEIIQRYFHTSKDGYQLHPTLREKIMFRLLNLKTPEYPMQGKFDLIFCRNVMIYFDEEFRREMAGRFYNLLNPGGYLIIGQTETISQFKTGFQLCTPAIYKKG